ncbi:MAG: N-methyl-L-tryptophan oxidase [Acidobacteria bacterium]|nr:MAG: N-methyl-L-tryptophan oxidase [Acidobacteriota bacterium]
MFDAIVGGVGGMGSATVYELARRGARVLGLEQFDIAHDRGSSHGMSRIIRLAYAEHPSYVPLLRRSYELWHELERATGERLLITTGGIDAGTPNSETIESSLRSCAMHDIPHEVLDAQRLHERFPGYRLPGSMVAVYQPDAGFLLPEQCVLSYVAAARNIGAEIRTNERVTRWSVDDGVVSVLTDLSSYRARKLILTVGPWASQLVPALRSLAVPERQVMLWTEPLRPGLFTPDVFPIFNLEAPEGRFYGFPMHGLSGFKIGKYHHRHERVDPDRVDRECHPEDEEVLREGVAHYFPDANGAAIAMKVCMFTNSPDEHFILDTHPEHPEVSIAAGFSGHGFKFCGVVGEIMAQLALEGGTSHDIGMFRLRRFTAQNE